MAMKWLEIIELRAAQIDQKVLNHQVALLLSETQFHAPVNVYINVRVETDWSIHLHHYNEQADPRGSEFALRLKAILKDYGIVNHSMWIEQAFNIKITK
jgi:hypothetical protein